VSKVLDRNGNKTSEAKTPKCSADKTVSLTQSLIQRGEDGVQNGGIKM